MRHTAHNLSAAARGAARGASRHWVEVAGRIGYATKGVVYTIIGVLAVQTALGTGGGTEGTQGALRTIATQPFGQVLLAATALGLLGYAVWRLVQAAVDASGKGSDVEGTVTRIGYAVSGIVYLGLAYGAARLVLGAGGGGGGATQQTWTARLLAQPFGPYLVGAVGLVIIGVAFYQFKRAYDASFMKSYRTGEMSPEERTWARRLGRFGLAARGVTFLIIGGFFIQAARQADASEARGLDAALDALARQPFGPWLLGVVALGMVAYGLYCFSQARHRSFT